MKANQFTLTGLLKLVTAVAIILAVVAAVSDRLNQMWFRPRDEALKAQAEIDAVFLRNQWSGGAAVYFYDYRIRVVSDEVGNAELSELKPIFQSLPWLRRIDLRQTAVTASGAAVLRDSLPRCRVSVAE